MTTPSNPEQRSLTRRRRVVTGSGILALFLPLVWADCVGAGGVRPATWLLPVALVVAAAAAGEFAAILGHRGLAPRRWLVVSGSVGVALAAALGSPAFRTPGAGGSPLESAAWMAVAATAVTVVALVTEILVYRPGGGALERLVGTGLALVMVALPLAFLVALRLLGTPTYDGGWHAPGLAPLVALIAAVKTGDVLAYLVGSTAGRNRMAPVLSPGKTWEGAAGSIAGALAASWIVLVPLRGLLDPADGAGAGPWGGWILHGIVVGVAGILGDLAESLVKREAGVKDSGTTLGALGGALDLVDSLLFAAPTAWLLWVFSFPS